MTEGLWSAPLGTTPSPRELELLEIITGDDEPTWRNAGYRMGISEETAKSYAKRLKHRAGCSTKLGLYRWGLAYGLLQAPKAAEDELRIPEGRDRFRTVERDEYGMTPRHREVFEARARGESTWHVSVKYGITFDTVLGYERRGLKALGCMTLKEARVKLSEKEKAA